MKKLIFAALFLVSISARSQTVQPQPDTAASPLDRLSYDELMQYYINEPDPPQFYKGPTEAGDSVYKILNPLTIPTQTVYADNLLHFTRGFYMTGAAAGIDTTNRVMQRFKPKVALGMGVLGFNGDLYKKHFQPISTARPAFDLNISQRLTRYLQLDFTVLFGKLGANEWLNNRQENFQSEIRAGGVSLMYDFGNFIPDRFALRPFVSFGVLGFEFLSKTDLKDKNGNTYYYWADGSIKDRPEGAPDAQFAKDLKRDYKYETDIRERNADGFGKYPERAWSFPIGAGVVMKVTDRIDVKLAFQYFLTTTDYLDGITNKSVGSRAGTRGKDKFTYTSVSIQYDLITLPKKKINPMADTLNNDFWLALDKEDRDRDGVPDLSDNCQGTEAGVAVDLKGCPLDDDQDGIPNYRDDELATPLGTPVNERGVGQTDDYWAAWYAAYQNDSTSASKSTEYVGNFFTQGAKKPKKEKKGDGFAVELARYKGSIPTDELAFLLSIGDINSTTLDDGTTVVYTAGNYDKIAAAVKRRDEFRNEGNKAAGISRIIGKDIVQIPDDELEKMLSAELKDLMAVNIDKPGIVDSTKSTLTDANAAAAEKDNFSKEDVVYRVQLGAFKNKISTNVFNTSAGVLELKTGESIYRYVTRGYKTIEEAAAVRADLVLQGYSDAFVTSYKEGKRIALNQTKATVDKSYKEDLSEDKIFSSVNKKLVTFKIQLGPLKRPALEASMDEKVKVLGNNSEKQTTGTGSIRYTSGSFNNFDEAEKYRKDLEEKGFSDAFIIATFKNEIISIQEALELMK
jgi:hypothetical protein